MQYNVYMCLKLVYISKSLYIWLHIVIYTHICTILVPRGARDQFPVDSYPGSWCALHPPATSAVQCHPTSL